MNAPTFTPGPWTTHEIMNSTEGVVLIESADDCIARVLVIDDSDLANARLIKAAPTMYAALQSVEREGRDANADGDVVIPSEVWDQVRAALAEAVQP